MSSRVSETRESGVVVVINRGNFRRLGFPLASWAFAIRAWVAALVAREYPSRLVLACTLAQGEYSVGHLEEMLGIHQPNLFQQLGVLRDAGVVATRRDAKQIFSRLTEENAAELIKALYGIFCAPPEAS